MMFEFTQWIAEIKIILEKELLQSGYSISQYEHKKLDKSRPKCFLTALFAA